MTVDQFLASLNIVWNLAAIGLLIAVLRSLWTIEAQADEGLQLLKEIRAELNAEPEPLYPKSAAAWNTSRPETTKPQSNE
jgi:hypothetical protein